MGRARGSGNVFDAVIGRASGIPTPIMPTENIGMMSGAIRKKRGGRRRDERGSRRGVKGGMVQVTMRDPKTGKRYGGLVKDGVPQFKAPDGSTPPPFPKNIDASGIAVDPVTGKLVAPSKVIGRGRPKPFPNMDKRVVSPRRFDPRIFDPSKPSAVQETTRVNVQDPTLGGPPEREVPLPKEKDMTPRGPAPFAPDEGDVAKQRFFETMFERAANRKERSGIDKGEMRDRQEARRDEAMMRDSERGRKRPVTGTVVKRRRSRRRDFTRKRSRMEGRRSREERAAFRDRYVSTLGSNFFS